jgi:beta-glucosidase/6-phospho-beta-glucosidase/beta-galactosidase
VERRLRHALRLVYVDFERQKQTPKLSAEYYREVLAQHAAV